MAKKLILQEREKIFEYLNKGYVIRDIAIILNRHRSSIYREINRLSNAYSPSLAQLNANNKAKNSKKKEKFFNEDLKCYVLSRLKLFWSPEQISKRLKIDYPKYNAMHVCTETIYQFIYTTQNMHEKRKLISYLRQRKKYRFSRKGQNEKRGKIPNMTSIHKRSKKIDKRKSFGHWEGDLVIGKDHQTAIGTLVERKSRYTIIVPLIKKKDSYSTVSSFINVFKQLPGFLKKTLTYDRGKEMSFHEMLTKETGILVYFADPHSPWQRGTNENTNGLIRTFFPKGTDFSMYSEDDFSKVQKLLNNRPRKALRFLTPNEFLLKRRFFI